MDDEQRAVVAAGRRAPFLVRYPVVGFGISLLGLALFMLLAVHVSKGAFFTRYDHLLTQAFYNHWAESDLLRGTVVPLLAWFGREIIVLMLYLLVRWGRRRCYRELSFLVLTVGLCPLISLWLAAIYREPRPVVPGLEPLPFGSFPSGHTMAGAVSYGLMLYLVLPRVRSRALAWVLILLEMLLVFALGLTRVYIGAHHLSDVVGGLALGMAWGGFSLTALELYWWYYGRRGTNPNHTQRQREDGGI
jgi:undecaprenyl-diphosphatase